MKQARGLNRATRSVSMKFLTAPHRHPSRVSRLASRFMAIAFAVALAAQPALARAPGAIAAARDLALHQLDLQLELPADDSMDKPSWWPIHIPPEFLFAGLLLGLAIIAYQFRDMLLIGRWSRKGDWAGEQQAEGEGAPAAPSATVAADELARQGRFVDAMHLLLLQSLAAIRERLDEPFADSLTSREILRSTRLSESGKALLHEIVARVEWSYFGQHPAERADYDACRARFDALVQALREEVPA